MPSTHRKSQLMLLGITISTLAACSSAPRNVESDVGSPRGVSMATSPGLLADWPEKQRQTAAELTLKYGPPDVVSEQLIAWFNNGPFVKTVIMREAVPHNFPMAHSDYLTQTIRHRVPAGRVNDLFEYDGSVYVHRTRGEITAQCDLEAMNFLALNLAHDIATGRRSVADARAFYARTAMAFKQGDKSSAYVTGLTFAQEANAADPDRPHQM